MVSNKDALHEHLRLILEDTIVIFDHHGLTPNASADGIVLSATWRNQETIHLILKHISPEENQRSESLWRTLWRIIDPDQGVSLQMTLDQMHILQEMVDIEERRSDPRNTTVRLASVLARVAEAEWLAAPFGAGNDCQYLSVMMDLMDKLHRPAISIPPTTKGFCSRLLTCLDSIASVGSLSQEKLLLVQSRLTFAMTVFYLMRLSAALDAAGMTAPIYGQMATAFKTCGQQLIRWNLRP